MTPDQFSAAFSRRPSSAVTRLGARQLLLLSLGDLLHAAAAEGAMLVALVAPAASALLGFARAARDAGAPLILVRPSGCLGEKSPEEARDDAAFVEAAFRAAEEVGFRGPMALLKDPPPPNAAQSDADRVSQEIDAGFTGLSLCAAPGEIPASAAEAGKAASALELGLELVPASGNADDAAALVATLRARGARPSTVRLTGFESHARGLHDKLGATLVSSAADGDLEPLLRFGVAQLVSSAPFLRALKRSAPADLWDKLSAHCKERNASIEQAASRHQRQIRDLPQQAQDKLEALASFEAAELYARAGAIGTGTRLLARVGEMKA